MSLSLSTKNTNTVRGERLRCAEGSRLEGGRQAAGNLNFWFSFLLSVVVNDIQVWQLLYGSLSLSIKTTYTVKGVLKVRGV